MYRIIVSECTPYILYLTPYTLYASPENRWVKPRNKFSVVGKTLFAQEASKLKETPWPETFPPGETYESCKIKRRGVFFISKSLQTYNFFYYYHYYFYDCFLFLIFFYCDYKKRFNNTIARIVNQISLDIPIKDRYVDFRHRYKKFFYNR